MKKDLVYRNGRVDPFKFQQSIWHEKFEPQHIGEMEMLRHAAVLRYKDVLRDKWKRFVALFNEVPPSDPSVSVLPRRSKQPGIKTFYGVHARYVKPGVRPSHDVVCYQGHYELEMVVFKMDEGISHHYVDENDTNAIDFVRCLDDNQLPKYINSGSDKVRETVIRRLKGEAGLTPYPKRQDLVDLYYRTDVMLGRIRRVIGYYDEILIHHFQNMRRRIDRDPLYEEPRITLSINGRLYIFEGGKLAHTPEHANYVFFEGDLDKEDPVSDDFGDQYRYSVVQRDRSFLYRT